MSGVLQWNCRGLSSKIGELKTRILNNKLHVWALLLQETNALPAISGFSGHVSPSMVDRRVHASAPPGKAAVYVASCSPQIQLSLERWCNSYQEVVAVAVKFTRATVVVVSCYVRPAGGSPSRINLGWLLAIRQQYPGCPILVGGDFNAPHSEWGYPVSSPRGRRVRDAFADASFVLLNQPGAATRAVQYPRGTSYAPDLTWWLGPGTPLWHLEPDCWGSDHHPIIIGLHPSRARRLRRELGQFPV